ncbi:cupin domain-containing protein [Paenibacillus sp. LHD-117]|uniref:cupin domain-containing protein n=1 Tax=Paenibacillus sp. LHD-117 TaxID=3071412 RepID=UPI0027DFC610|nr:cupin domain-containing protein [Paenibacillus sp. LHD-117]MDQ6421756.1 cupin domain-containing protein [Paenibacillus sp. LHD-117]
MKVSKKTGENYNWGSNCDGWHLVNNDDLSIIHERMPPGTKETRHYHNRSRQFFFVLSGMATVEMNGEQFEVEAQEGLEVPPLTPHQVFNRTNDDIEFLVVSQPTTKGDRILLEE